MTSLKKSIIIKCFKKYGDKIPSHILLDDPKKFTLEEVQAPKREGPFNRYKRRNCQNL